MSKNSPRTLRIFWTIILATFICLVINLPRQFTLFGKTFYKPNLSLNKNSTSNLDLRYGLDLAGGASLLYEIDTSQGKSEDLIQALESLKANIERRVNLFGVSEANVQISKQDNQYRLKVELPGVTDINDAINLIGQTATLKFVGQVKEFPLEATSSAEIKLEDYYQDTGINGSHLIRATPQPNPQTGVMEVALEFNSEGTKLFEQATSTFLNKRLAIFLDDELISAPLVQVVIPDGKAVISGNFDIKTAKTFSAQLNAGALTLPIKKIQEQQIGATLGQDTINKGLRAGLVGLGLVSFFMIGNYGYLGVISVISLIIYSLFTLTIYRIFHITLTFPGIVGFILYIGMAVDSNILIFERMKEEIHVGQSWNNAMELGFGRAWNSIKDANICTIITGLILFNPFNWSFLNSSGMVRGFSVTLLIGVFLGIFTGVVVTRNILRVLAHKKT